MNSITASTKLLLSKVSLANASIIGQASTRITPSSVGNSPVILLNHDQTAGYKKRQTRRLLRQPDFTDYDKLPGDDVSTAYVGFYDDKRHTLPMAQDRFYRLNWGGWIRARGGRGTKMWAKTGERMWWTKQHVLCSARQTEQLEQMFEQKFRKKTFFVDDPYEDYEERNDHEFLPYGHRPYSYSYLKAKDYDS